MFELGGALKLKASEEGAMKISEQLNNISSLKKSLMDEVRFHLGHLNGLAKRWHGFNEQMDKFVEYMDKVDSRLERRKESRVSQEWLNQIKVCNE